MVRLNLSEYDMGLDALSESINADVATLLSKREEFATTADFRQFLGEQIPELSRKYEVSASALASDNYSQWRKKVTGKQGSTVTSEPDTQRVKKSAYSLSHPLKEADLGNLTDDEAVKRTEQQLTTMLDRRVRTAARESMMSNSRRDKDGIGCASIPRGRTTCAFCLEMAAVGFAYSFKVMDIEGRTFHDHCDCRFVPGFIGHSVEVDGYSSEAIRNALNDVKHTLGLKPNVTLTNEVLRLINAELAKRDTTWIQTGTPARAIYEKKWKNLSDKERVSSRILLEHGIEHTFLKEDLSANANIDLKINGQFWEEKSPKNKTRSSVFENLADAKSKWVRLGLDDEVRVVYSNVFGLRDDKIIKAEIEEMMQELQIAEVLFINRGGTLQRLLLK